MLFADSFTEFLPPLSAPAAVALAVGVPLALVVLGKLLGPANSVSRRWSLWILRGAIFALVAVVLLNPVRVDELPGPVERPEIFYLLDTSASMQLGSPQSRWDESLDIIARGHQNSASSPARAKMFRFGQRLAAVEHLPDREATKSKSVSATNSEAPLAATGGALDSLAPTDADTRLLSALRQISSRFGRVPPLGIVVFSDGRARDEVGLEQLAADFGRLQTPIHVAAVGDVSKGGDIALAAVVAPQRARKFTEVEVQVFLRSFGFDGKRGEVQLLEIGDRNGAEGNDTNREATERQIASLPITLQSGFQSVSLSFRTDLNTRKLRVRVPPLANEISEGNNQVDTEMAIDRTKIRVLYIEGSPQPLTQTFANQRLQIRGPFTDFKQALVADDDIECVVLVRPNGIGRLVRMTEQGQIGGLSAFPTTMAELAAFDAVVLSNVAADSFSDEQLGWIEPWIGQRGAGLCMVGGEQSFASGGWSETRLGPMLPVELLPAGLDWLPGEAVRLVAELPPTPHPIWTLLADDKQNRQIVRSLPSVTAMNRWAGARANLATVLATAEVPGMPRLASTNEVTADATTDYQIQLTKRDGEPAAGAGSVSGGLPAIVVGRYGRGRTAALAFPITSSDADELVQRWGQGDNRYYAKFCRNLVYWLTESSAIGRRRLVASADKRFYRPGETIAISAATYDESASPTKNYRVVAMVEPHTAPGEDEPEASPLRWPSGMPRTSGEEGPLIVWGEEFDLPLGGANAMNHTVQLPLAEVLASGTSSQSLRVELTAYEDLTQIDSTSLDIQVLHDPFEQQNPFPNHDLLARLAAGSGGTVLHSADDLAALLRDVPAAVGTPIVRRVPLWSNAWFFGLLLGLLTVEWCWRRALGLA